MTKGLYIGGEFVSFAEAKSKVNQPSITQIASRSTASGISSLGSILPNPDPILKKMGKDITVYKDIRSHAVVKGALRRRKAAVKAKAWRIVQDEATDQVFDSINRIFKKLQINKITGSLFDATWFGYQPCEITWAYQDGAWLPVKIDAMPPEWFFFDKDNQLRFKDKNAGQDGLLIDERQYLVPTQDASYENPYGERDSKLSTTGVRFSNQYYEREYGFQEGDLLPPIEPPPPVSFAEATFTPVGQNPIDQATQELEIAAEPLLNDMVNRIRSVVRNETSFQSLQDAILAEFSELPTDELTQVMSIALAFSELQGRSEVKDGD